MSTDQRVASTTVKLGQGRASQPTAPVVADTASRRPRRKRLLIVVLTVVLVVGGGTGYWLVLGPGAPDPAVEEVEPHPEAGVVQAVEAVSINLADGRYLRLALALQLPADAEEELDPSKALDQAISLFSGRSLEEVSSPDGRLGLKAELNQLLQEAYEGEVLEVFFTEYVTQ